MTAHLPAPYVPIPHQHAYAGPPMQHPMPRPMTGPMVAPPVVFMAQPQAEFCPGPGAVGNFPGLQGERCNHGLWLALTIVGGLLTFGGLALVFGVIWLIIGLSVNSTNKARITTYNRQLSMRTGRPVPAGYPGAVYPAAAR